MIKPPFFRLLSLLVAGLLALPPQTAGAQNMELPLLLSPILAGAGNGMDSDGDGLPDGWERHGYTEGGVFVDLPALGANPRHKDLFVWMDYMVVPNGGPSLAPSQTVINNIKQVFANAPVANPDGTTGITIHPLLKSQVPYVETLGQADDWEKVWLQFDSIKNDFFEPAYAKSFRYMIWANSYNENSSSGLARNIPATDFLVTLGLWSPAGGSDWQKVGTFIHELGHCLGLTHGGADHENYKPNYLSVMNYFFQISGLYKDGHWGDASNNALLFDYQRFDTPVLNENALDETIGFGNLPSLTGYGTRYYAFAEGSWGEYMTANVTGPIDWNRDGVFGVSVAADINGDGSRTSLAAQNNWANIDYSAAGLIGRTASAAARRRADARPMPEELRHELDYKTSREQSRRRQAVLPAP